MHLVLRRPAAQLGLAPAVMYYAAQPAVLLAYQGAVEGNDLS